MAKRKQGSTNWSVAGIAARPGRSFVRKRIDRRLAATGITTKDIARVAAGKGGFGSRLAAAVLVRLATRSVPGALVVGGGLVAKALLARRRRAKAAAAVDEQMQ